MKSIPNALPLKPISIQIGSCRTTNPSILLYDSNGLKRVCPQWRRSVMVRSSVENGGVKMGRDWVEERVVGMKEMVGSLPKTVSVMRSNIDIRIAVGLCIASVVVLTIAARRMMLTKHRHNYQGSVSDLVRRGQLRPDRRGISKPLKYEDPFDNPLVKVGKSNSTVQMCGKVYRLAPVTLTEEEQSIHQKRRSRAYQWKRPTTFLKEGDPMPPDVDPDTVNWIPANHPFATTVSDIDETLAQTNVNQKTGVPYRIKAEHDAMQKKLEALQNGQNFNQEEIDPRLIGDLQSPFKSSSRAPESLESGSLADPKSAFRSSKSDQDDLPDNQSVDDKRNNI